MATLVSLHYPFIYRCLMHDHLYRLLPVLQSCLWSYQGLFSQQGPMAHFVRFTITEQSGVTGALTKRVANRPFCNLCAWTRLSFQLAIHQDRNHRRHLLPAYWVHEAESSLSQFFRLTRVLFCFELTCC